MSFQQQYVTNVYDKIAERFSTTRAYLWRGVKEFILDLNRNSLILDAGCGNAGPFILWLFHQGMKEVHGIDLGDQWIDKLQTFFSSKGIKVVVGWSDIYLIVNSNPFTPPTSFSAVAFSVIFA